jgi:hypothetical protein
MQASRTVGLLMARERIGTVKVIRATPVNAAIIVRLILVVIGVSF